MRIKNAGSWGQQLEKSGLLDPTSPPERAGFMGVGPEQSPSALHQERRVLGLMLCCRHLEIEASWRAQIRSGLGDSPQAWSSESSPSPGPPETAGNPQRRAMESWLETHWARPFHLAFVFCLALGLLLTIKLYVRRQRLLRDLRAFPGPAASLFPGHQKLLEGENFEKLEEIVEKYPCAFPFWIGPFQAFFYIYDLDYAKTFLSRTDPKSNYLYKFLVPSVGEGLLNLNGPKWFQH